MSGQARQTSPQAYMHEEYGSRQSFGLGSPPALLTYRTPSLVHPSLSTSFSTRTRSGAVKSEHSQIDRATPEAIHLSHQPLVSHSLLHSPRLIGNQDGMLVNSAPGKPHSPALRMAPKCDDTNLVGHNKALAFPWRAGSQSRPLLRQQ
jgi:hypothetical protein